MYGEGLVGGIQGGYWVNLKNISIPDKQAVVEFIDLYLQERRGSILDQTYIDNTRIMFKAIFPLNEILIDFFDELKTITSGYAR